MHFGLSVILVVGAPFQHIPSHQARLNTGGPVFAICIIPCAVPATRVSRFNLEQGGLPGSGQGAQGSRGALSASPLPLVKMQLICNSI